MNTLTLRKKLINQIENIENVNVLEDIYTLLELAETDLEKTSTYKLNEEQEKVIAMAREEIKNGEYLTDKEANEEIEEWLNK